MATTKNISEYGADINYRIYAPNDVDWSVEASDAIIVSNNNKVNSISGSSYKTLNLDIPLNQQYEVKRYSISASTVGGDCAPTTDITNFIQNPKFCTNIITGVSVSNEGLDMNVVSYEYTDDTYSTYAISATCDSTDEYSYLEIAFDNNISQQALYAAFSSLTGAIAFETINYNVVELTITPSLAVSSTDTFSASTTVNINDAQSCKINIDITPINSNSNG